MIVEEYVVSDHIDKVCKKFHPDFDSKSDSEKNSIRETARAWLDCWTETLPPINTRGGILMSCGVEKYPLDAYIWDRRGEWVLEISGEINDTCFTSRHTQTNAVNPEDVAGLPEIYEALNKAELEEDNSPSMS